MPRYLAILKAFYFVRLIHLSLSLDVEFGVMADVWCIDALIKTAVNLFAAAYSAEYPAYEENQNSS